MLATRSLYVSFVVIMILAVPQQWLNAIYLGILHSASKLRLVSYSETFSGAFFVAGSGSTTRSSRVGKYEFGFILDVLELEQRS